MGEMTIICEDGVKDLVRKLKSVLIVTITWIESHMLL